MNNGREDKDLFSKYESDEKEEKRQKQIAEKMEAEQRKAEAAARRAQNRQKRVAAREGRKTAFRTRRNLPSAGQVAAFVFCIFIPVALMIAQFVILGSVPNETVMNGVIAVCCIAQLLFSVIGFNIFTRVFDGTAVLFCVLVGICLGASIVTVLAISLT